MKAFRRSLFKEHKRIRSSKRNVSRPKIEEEPDQPPRRSHSSLGSEESDEASYGYERGDGTSPGYFDKSGYGYGYDR